MIIFFLIHWIISEVLPFLNLGIFKQSLSKSLIYHVVFRKLTTVTLRLVLSHEREEKIRHDFLCEFYLAVNKSGRFAKL